MSTPTYAEKVITLLVSDSKTFEQGLTLLEGLASGGCSDAVLQDVSTLFQGVDWDDLCFHWMVNILEEVEENGWYAEVDEQEFKSRQGDIFWRMIGCWLQFYPEMRHRLPSVLVLKRSSSLPKFLFSETSVNTLVIQGVENIDGFERLPTFEKIVFPPYSFQHHKYEIDWNGMLEGQNSQTIVVDESILALRLVSGQLQIEARTGVFTELMYLSSDPSLHLPLVDHGMTVEQIFQVFEMQTERSSLDFGFVCFELNGELSRPVHERIVGIYFKRLENIRSRSNSLLQELLNRPVSLLNLIEIVGDIELYDPILIDKGFLSRAPNLERIVLSATEPCLSVSADVWTMTMHPLQSIYVKAYEDCVLYTFKKDDEKTLGEQLWMVSAVAEDVIQAAEYLKNVQYVHLFQSYGNLAQLTRLSALEDLQIELARLEQSAWMKKYGVYPTDFTDILSRSFGLDLSEWTQNKVSDTYYVVQTCEDWMCFERFQIAYKFASDFMSKFQLDIKRGAYTPEFAEWFSHKGSVRIGAWVCWAENGSVQLKRYTSTGFEYWDEYRSSYTRFSILNLERLAIGLDQSELCDLLRELKELNDPCKIRLNTPRVDAALFGYLPPIHTMYVEEKGVLDYMDVFPSVEVLYLNGLGLTTVPEFIASMPQLDTLYLWNNQLQTLPNSLSNLQNLRVINISGNPFNEVPAVLFSLPKLEKLFFRDGVAFLNTHMSDDDRWNGEMLGNALLLDANV